MSEETPEIQPEVKKEKKSLLPNLEVLIVIVFFLSFLIFMIPKCNQTQIDYSDAALEAENLEEEKPIVAQKKENPDTSAQTAIQDSLLAADVNVNNPLGEQTVLSKADLNNLPTITTNDYATKLYVTIDQLNMRKGPSLDSAIIVKLPLFEEVFFLNEITDFTQKISLGPEIAEEPWVKIKTNKGDTGWVYGAGVYYYKRKRLPDTE